MNSKNKVIFDKIFHAPTKNDITYKEVVKLLKSEGIKIKNGKGSRRKFIYNQRRIHFHEPHDKVLPEYVVELVREFLEITGIKP